METCKERGELWKLSTKHQSSYSPLSLFVATSLSVPSLSKPQHRRLSALVSSISLFSNKSCFARGYTSFTVCVLLAKFGLETSWVMRSLSGLPELPEQHSKRPRLNVVQSESSRREALKYKDRYSTKQTGCN